MSRLNIENDFRMAVILVPEAGAPDSHGEPGKRDVGNAPRTVTIIVLE
jgi:hypothetical protein